MCTDVAVVLVWEAGAVMVGASKGSQILLWTVVAAKTNDGVKLRLAAVNRITTSRCLLFCHTLLS
jgi:hypothetical protein